MFGFTRNRLGALDCLNIAAICLLLLWVSNFAKAQTKDAKSTEVLIVPPYPSEPRWKEITNKKNDRMELVEWVPADQRDNTKGLFVRHGEIRDILTKQIFYTAKDEDPSAFVSRILAGVSKACQRARVNGPKAQTENGYPVAYAQAYCVNQKGAATDVDIFIKAIHGKDALYVVQREFRRPAQRGATPGITEFSQDQLEEMKARILAQQIADRFLVEDVQLCPLTGGTGACDKTSTSGTSVEAPKESH
ncbi:MAG: hypothetical protein ACJ71U_18285 [Terriglobales bacterium]